MQGTRLRLVSLEVTVQGQIGGDDHVRRTTSVSFSVEVNLELARPETTTARIGSGSIRNNRDNNAEAAAGATKERRRRRHRGRISPPTPRTQDQSSTDRLCRRGSRRPPGACVRRSPRLWWGNAKLPVLACKQAGG